MAVHNRRAKKFYQGIKLDVQDTREEKNVNVLSLAVDYMQNISLPKIPVQELFYLRQLTVSVFSIHDVKRNVLLHYLSTCPQEYDELNFYADNCGGQNKNHCFSKLFMALTDNKWIKKVNQFFPIRRHSFWPCDRDFSLIKRELRRHGRVYSIQEIKKIILKCSNQSLQ